MKFAIIGGTGVLFPQILESVREEEVQTPFGDVRGRWGQYKGKEIFFLARHGERESIPPHKVNYRANIWAIKQLDISNIYATAAVGSLNSELSPGELVLIDQFIDFTKIRKHTFFEPDSPVAISGEAIHIDMTEPYCLRLRNHLKTAAEDLSIPVHQTGTYVCTEGPRFETRAEIAVFKKLGADVVGMTTVPEVVLAREAEICYATVAVVTNYAAGISETSLSSEEVEKVMKENIGKLQNLIFRAIEIAEETDCVCRHALNKYEKCSGTL